MKTKKKYRIIAIIGAVVILLFAVFFTISYKKTDILNVSADEIKSISVKNGLTGNMVDIPSSDFSDYAQALNEVKLEKGQKMESTGWDYMIYLSNGKKEYIVSFVSEQVIVIGEKRYETKEQSGVKLYNLCERCFKYKN